QCTIIPMHLRSLLKRSCPIGPGLPSFAKCRPRRATMRQRIAALSKFLDRNLPASMRRLSQQFGKMILPDGGPGVRAMAVRLVAERDQHELPMRDRLDLRLRNAQLR